MILGLKLSLERKNGYYDEYYLKKKRKNILHIKKFISLPRINN